MSSCLIKCELCGLNMKTRLNGSHLKRIHNISLKEYNESEIINDRAFIPKIKYIENQKERTHCPDFYIKSDNLLIDVKSIYTYNLHKENMSLKQNAAIQCGFKYKIYIFNDDGTINKII